MKVQEYWENIDREALRQKADRLLDYAGEARVRASQAADYAVERARGFSLLDFVIFKVCILSVGLWLGASMAGAVKRLRYVLAAVFAASWFYLLWRILLSDEE